MKTSTQKCLSIEEVKELFQLFFQSGLSLAAFARQQKIPYSRLIYYKRRLLNASPLPPQTHPLKSSSYLDSQNSPQFLQIFPTSTLPQEHTPFFLKAGPFQLSIPEQFSADAFSNILEVLKQHV
jgi:hypothetical protein